MLVHKQKKALVLKLRNTAKVTALIPMAKLFDYKGQQLVAVPHTLDVVKVLRNLGLKAPAPIMSYYSWPGQYKPFAAQSTTSAFLTMNTRAFVLNEIGCVDADTEYLSDSGWKRIADYAGGKVAQYHPETGVAEFVEPTEFVKLPCAEMLRIKTKYGIDQMLSLEHRVLLQSRANPDKREVVQAAELLRRHDGWLAGEKDRRSYSRIAYSEAAIPVTFQSAGGTGLALSDDELRLQVALIADGSFPSSTNRCYMRLKKDRKKGRLRTLLDSAGVAFTERDVGLGYSLFTFRAPLRKKVFDTYFWGASSHQLAIIAGEVMHWDGCIGKGSRGDRFSTHEKESADFVQYAMSGTGNSARIINNVRERRGAVETEYVVQVRNNPAPIQMKGVSGTIKRSAMQVEPSTDGYKYCFMVPSTFLVFRRNGCVFASGNTGKSLAALWAYDYLRSIGKAKKLFVVSPLSTLERTWGDELFHNFSHLNYAVLHGSRDKRIKLLRQDVDVYIINHDGVEVVANEMKDRDDITHIVIDEVSQVARNASTARWKALNLIVNKQTPRTTWGLTGTPVPNAPTDAWAQCKLIVPETVPKYANRFRDQVMRQVSTYKWEPRDTALDVVRDAMQPSIRFTRDECVDLPPCMYETREVELSSEQKKAFKEMVSNLSTEYGAGQITAVNEAVKLSKLIQICCGSAFGTTGEQVIIPAPARLAAVHEIVEEAGAKVIVFVPFVAVVSVVADYLRSKGVTVEFIHGGVSKTERDRILKAFQKSPNPRVLVAQPATLSHGLTLTEANTIVWYAPITSNDIATQAEGRITRPGQRNNQFIIQLSSTPLENKMYARLKSKQQVQGLLLDMIKDEAFA